MYLSRNPISCIFGIERASGDEDNFGTKPLLDCQNCDVRREGDTSVHKLEGASKQMRHVICFMYLGASGNKLELLAYLRDAAYICRYGRRQNLR